MFQNILVSKTPFSLFYSCKLWFQRLRQTLVSYELVWLSGTRCVNISHIKRWLIITVMSTKPLINTTSQLAFCAKITAKCDVMTFIHPRSLHLFFHTGHANARMITAGVFVLVTHPAGFALQWLVMRGWTRMNDICLR